MSGADERQRGIGNAWGDEIAPERQAKLETLFQRQVEWAAKPEAERGGSTFDEVPLTGADVFWLAARTLAGTIEAVAVAEQMWQLWQARDDVTRQVQLRLDGLHLEGAGLYEASLEGANLFGAYLEGANLFGAYLERAFLHDAHLEGANLRRAHLERANVGRASLERANLRRAHLERANLDNAHLEGANLFGAHLEGANLDDAHLEGANLVEISLDKTSRLNGAVLTEAALDQVTFDNANLTVVDWSLVPMLGDEVTARRARDATGKSKKPASTRLTEFRAAVRANRVLAVTLRAQGLNEDADRFAYRAQVCQRAVFRRQRKLGAYLFSAFLDVLAGYGYRPARSVRAYLFVVLAFATAYFILGPVVGVPFPPLGAVVFSMTSFHGRGFFPGGSPGHSITLDDPLTVVAACEALVGLAMEISFFATITNRFFSR